MTCSRRCVLQGLGAAAGALVVLPSCSNSGSSLSTAATTACGTSTCIDLGDASNQPLTSVGGAMLIDLPHDTVMVIRTGPTAVLALSAICTHAGCSMDYDGGGHQITCPCHGSVFGEDGHVITGPARRALAVYQANLTGTTITVVAG